MKKFLSLVLALVMTASLVTVSAGAKEFKDDKDVTYDEAVAVISEIGVVDGDTDGNFRPTDNLSRGAAAKIICNLILGPTTAAELKADTAPYKDVPVSNTFSGYIAYCAKEGIISGYADGSFRPAGTLTGYAFMKMLLGALGYDGTYEGYTGANWSINVAKQAIGIGLNKGLTDEFNGVDFVTREEAALYAFNTLKATMVDYDQKITTNVNGVDVTISQGNAKPVTWTEGKNNDGNIKDDKFVQFAEEFFPDLVRKGDSTKFEAPANTWVYDKVEIGTYERTDLIVESYTTEVTGKDVYDLLKASVIKDNELKVYEDGKDKYGENSTDKVGKDDLARSNNNKLITTGDGALTKVYLDTDKDEITIVTINTYLAKASADYSESKEYASLGVYETSSNPVTFNVDVEDVANVVDVKKDAFYQVTVSYKDATRGEVVTVGDVEILEDSTVTKFSTKKNDDETASRVSKLTTGGEEYKANVKAFYDDDVLDLYDEDLLTGKTYNVYVDSNGYFLGVDLFEGTKNYVFITGYDKNISNLSIKTADAAGIFLDGTMKTIKVNVTDTNENIDAATKENKDNASHFDSWSSSSGEFDHNRWYTYTEADGVYTLKPAVRMTATTSMKGSNDVIRTDALSLVDDINKNNRVYGEDATVFLTVDTGKVGSGTDDAITEVSGVYTGVQNVEIEVDLKAAVKPHIYTVYDSDHYVIAAVVLGESIGSNQNLAYILSGAKSEEIKDGVYYWEFEAVMNGEVKTLTAKSKYKSTITTLKNSIDEVVELRFDGDYVVDVKDDVKLYKDPSEHIDGEAAYYLAGLKDTENTVTYQGGTMYIRNDKVNDVGLGIAKDAKAVVIQKENNKEKKTEFTSVEAAIAHLADPDDNSANGKQYNGIIAAALNANGTAAWVVFDSTTPLNSGGNVTPPVGPGPEDKLENYNVVENLGGGNFVVNYYDGDNKMEIADVDAYVKAQLESYTGLKVKSYSSITGVVIFEDGSVFGTKGTATAQRLVAIKVDGAIEGYAKYNDNDSSPESVNLSGLTKDGAYLLEANKTNANTDLTADAKGEASVSVADKTTTDVKYVSAYTVTHSLTTNLTYDKAGSPTTVNSGHYVQKDLVLTASIAADSDYHQLVVNGEKVGESKKGNGTDKTAFTYTVTGKVDSMSISTGYMVKLNGQDLGVYAVNAEVGFTGPIAGATYALGKNVDANGKATAVLTVASTPTAGQLVNAGTTFVYMVQAADANAGVIDLVQVAEVDALTDVGATYKVGNVDTAINAGEYFKVGTEITVTETDTDTTAEKIQIAVNGGTAADFGTPGTDTNDAAGKATGKHTIKGTDITLAFTLATV